MVPDNPLGLVTGNPQIQLPRAFHRPQAWFFCGKVTRTFWGLCMYKLYFLETLGGRGIQNQHNKSARIAWLAMVYSTKKSISSLEHEGNIKLSTFEWLRLRFSFDTFLSFKIFLISFSSMLDQSHPPSRSNAKTANVSSGSTSS